MGLDIHTYHQHTLDTSSAKALAEKLSVLLDINIDYGYYNMDGIAGFGNAEHHFIKLGEARCTRNEEAYILIDHYHIEKAILQEENQDFDRLKARHPFTEYAPGTQWYELLNKEEPVFNIYNHAIENNWDYYGRWWDLCRSVCIGDYFDNQYKKEEDFLSDFRKQNLELAKSLGADKVFYCPDDIADKLGGFLLDADKSWTEITEYIESKFGLFSYKIPEVFGNQNVVELLRKKHAFTQNVPSRPMDTLKNSTYSKIHADSRIYPEAFWDDGKDLRD